MLIKQGSSTWVVTAYFNPAGFQSRRDNLKRFLEGLRASRVPTLVVEMLGPDGKSEVDPAICELISLPQAGGIWQKECLLNIGARSLPRSADAIIWSDCDLVFERPDWLAASTELLKRFNVIQPFDTMTCLPAGGLKDIDQALEYESFCSVPSLGSAEKGYKNHGHPGFAWGARRELFDEIGLYDRALAGSADHLMAHAFANDLSSICIDQTFQTAQHYRSHFLKWASRARDYTQGRVAALPGRAYHLWHGRFLNRRYLQRERELAIMGFDPETDLVARNDGMLTLTARKPELALWAEEFFINRREDDKPGL